MLRKTQRRAWKALRGVGRLRRPLRRPHSARRGPRECPPWRLGESRVYLRSGLRAALGRNRPLGSAPERMRLGGEARGRERRESD